MTNKENDFLWLTYKLFCHNRGLAEGNLKTLEEFMVYRKDFYKEVWNNARYWRKDFKITKGWY